MKLAEAPLENVKKYLKFLSQLSKEELKTKIDIENTYFASGEFMHAAPGCYAVFPPLIFFVQILLITGIIWAKVNAYAWHVMETYGDHHCAQYVALTDLSLDDAYTKCSVINSPTGTYDPKWVVNVTKFNCVGTNISNNVPRVYKMKGQKIYTEAFRIEEYSKKIKTHQNLTYYVQTWNSVTAINYAFLDFHVRRSMFQVDYKAPELQWRDEGEIVKEINKNN
jgi:hypothetical protein